MNNLNKLQIAKQQLLSLEYEFEAAKIKLKHHLSPVVREVEAAFGRQEAYNKKLKKLLKRKIELEVGLKYIKDQVQKAVGL